MILDNYTITEFPNVASKDATPVKLYTFLKGVQNGRWADEVRSVRESRSKDERTERKARVHAVSLNVCEGGHSARDTREYNPLIYVDIDAQDNTHVEHFDELGAFVRKMPFVASVGHSVGGVGWFVLVRLADKGADFKAQFRALQTYFGHFGIVIDKACNDRTRMRYVSYDPELYINPNPDPFVCTVGESDGGRPQRAYTSTPGEPGHLNGARTTTQRATPRTFDHTDDMAKVREVAESLRGCKVLDDYGEWSEVGRILACSLGEQGREVFHGLSNTSAKYNRATVDRHYNTWLRSSHGYALGSFFSVAERYGADVSCNRQEQRAQEPREMFAGVPDTQTGHEPTQTTPKADEWGAWES